MPPIPPSAYIHQTPIQLSAYIQQTPIPLSAYIQQNSIKVRELWKSTTADIHFSNLDHEPNDLYPTRRISLDAIKEGLVKIQRFSPDSHNTWRFIEDLFFPHRLLLSDPHFKVENAALSTGELSLVTGFIRPAQQYAQLETKKRARKSRQTSRTDPQPPNRPPSQGATRSTSQARSRSASQVSKHSTLPSSTPPSSSQFDPVQVIQGQDELLWQLFPHTTFWLTLPASVISSEVIRGVLGSGLMFPYLTIVGRSKGEQLPEVRERAALIATCILSSHAKPLKLKGRCEHLLACPHHYVIIVDTDYFEFSVSEAKLDTDRGTTYLMSTLDSGKLSQDFERFELWLDRIHKWAVKIWKPMMMDAFSPLYLEYNDSELKGWS